MSIIRPPFTGNSTLDSWTNQITQALNMGLLLPGVQGQTGGGGASGNTAIYLYQRTAVNTAPSRPTSVTYDYTDIENVTITANNGWSGEIPDTSDKYLWITFRYISNLQDTITGDNSWNTVVLLSIGGDDGANGSNSARVLIHKKYSSNVLPASEIFSGTFTYTFASGVLSGGTINGWSQTATSLSAGEFLFTSEALAYSAEATVDIPSSSFSTPQITGAGQDVSSTIYLYDSSINAPSTPLATEGFNATTGNAVDTGTWTTLVPSIGSGQALWIATTNVTQVEGADDFTSDGWTVYQASGYDGTEGDPAPRFVSRRLYASSSTGTPGAPSATLTWSTLALSGITAGTPTATWSETAPTAVATSTTLVYFSDLLFIDVTGIATTSSDTGTTPKEGISFSGLVTFSDGDFALDGSTVTSIDGSNITTGSISGSPPGVNPPSAGSAPTGTEDGTSLNLTDGNLTIGNSINYLSWDGLKLTVQGDIINYQDKFFRGQGRYDYATITTDTDDLVSNGVVFTGWNAFGLVAGGGGSTGSCRLENNGWATSGGGGGATIQFGLFVDENDIINVDVGSGGSSGNTFATQAGAGGDTTFTLIRNGVTYVLTAGGGTGGRGNSYSLTSGGEGGVVSFTRNGASRTLAQMQALGIFQNLAEQDGGTGGDTPNTSSNSQGRGGGGGGGVDIYLTKDISGIGSTYVDGKIGNSTVGDTAYGGSIWGLATGYATSDLPASTNQTTAGTVPAGLVIYNSPLIDSTPDFTPGNFMGAAGSPRPAVAGSISGTSGGTPGGGAGGGSASWNSHNATITSSGGDGGVGIIYYVAL